MHRNVFVYTRIYAYICTYTYTCKYICLSTPLFLCHAMCDAMCSSLSHVHFHEVDLNYSYEERSTKENYTSHHTLHHIRKEFGYIYIFTYACMYTLYKYTCKYIYTYPNSILM